jgi:uncharacterized protein
MSDPLQSRPWYREPWPWIVMSGPAVVVVASFVSAYLAVHGADPVVDENYYQRGLQINVAMAQDQQARARQLESVLHIVGVRRGDDVRVELRSGDGRAITDTALRIRMEHNSDSRSARSAVLGRVPGDGPARYFGQWLQAPDDRLSLSEGSWQLVVEGSDWRLEGAAAGDAKLVAAR